MYTYIYYTHLYYIIYFLIYTTYYTLCTGGRGMEEDERQDIVECALECGKSMLRTLDDILTIAKSKNCKYMFTMYIFMCGLC